MNKTQTPNGSFNLNQQLDRYFLACSALVGVATLAGTQKAEATIQYSGLLNWNVPTTNGAGGVYIDIDSFQFYNTFTNGSAGGSPGPLTPTWDVNFYRSGSGNLRWYYNSNTYAVYSGSFVSPLAAGVTVDGSSQLGTIQAMQNFANTTAFMGVQFKQNGTGNPLFGWIRVAGGPTQGFPATIVDMAYDDSGAGIVTGAVPEPASIALGCLAMGAVGVSAWRKHKKTA